MMTRCAFAVAAAMALAGPAWAQDAAEDRQALRDCVFGQPATTAISCIGEIEAACLAARDDSDGATMACRVREVDAWTVLMDETLPGALSTAAEGDGSGAADVPPFDATLQSSQDAWRIWAAAECDLQAARWGTAPEAQLAWLDCARRLTAARVVELRILAEGW